MNGSYVFYVPWGGAQRSAPVTSVNPRGDGDSPKIQKVLFLTVFTSSGLHANTSKKAELRKLICICPKFQNSSVVLIIDRWNFLLRFLFLTFGTSKDEFSEFRFSFDLKEYWGNSLKFVVKVVKQCPVVSQMLLFSASILFIGFLFFARWASFFAIVPVLSAYGF